MAKKPKPTPKQKPHIFTLKGSNRTYYKTKIQADFTPQKRMPVLPIFNKDGNFMTPAFIVPFVAASKKVDYQGQHANKLAGLIEKSQGNIVRVFLMQFVPRPRPKKNYCSVCCREFDDYLEHVQSEPHKSQIRNSALQTQILKLCSKIRRQKFQKQQQIHQKSILETLLSKKTMNTQANQEDSVSPGFTKMGEEGLGVGEGEGEGMGEGMGEGDASGVAG